MLLEEIVYDCECVYVDENDEELLDEARKQFKRVGKEIKKRYRCTTGKKKGKLVSKPSLCGTRKNPKRVRIGRKSARVKKGLRVLKSKVTKKKSLSRMVTRVNKRLSGN